MALTDRDLIVVAQPSLADRKASFLIGPAPENSANGQRIPDDWN